jgi:hypothetical protein
MEAGPAIAIAFGLGMIWVMMISVIIAVGIRASKN